ncbi:MAG: hypothetical protein M1820_010835 [Bogoriella megaspora]|nr:MAG: hypothetical protein M1820_010835 [Bogoriella megaspora]
MSSVAIAAPLKRKRTSLPNSTSASATTARSISQKPKNKQNTSIIANSKIYASTSNDDESPITGISPSKPYHIMIENAQSPIFRLSILNLAKANTMAPSNFISTYYPSSLPSTISTPSDSYDIYLSYASDLPPSDFEQCFRLVEGTSSTAYKTSSRGWKPQAKKREMREEDMRYLLVRKVAKQNSEEGVEEGGKQLHQDTSQPRGENVEDSKVEGFLSFMLTFEDRYPVLYIYEIHMREELRGHGVGRALMRVAEGIAQRVNVEKIMLTVFTSNEAARGFYRRLGYEVDEYSPGEKRLRGGKVKKPDYEILSKEVGKGTTIDGRGDI